ncbi:hypothetical protein P3T39_003504 [Kitasatospora sp. GP82]|nr:hypothetical protein [Kitasatospora sp. GP82]
MVFQGIGHPGTVRADACPVLPAERLENTTPIAGYGQTQLPMIRVHASRPALTYSPFGWSFDVIQ